MTRLRSHCVYGILCALLSCHAVPPKEKPISAPDLTENFRQLAIRTAKEQVDRTPIRKLDRTEWRDYDTYTDSHGLLWVVTFVRRPPMGTLITGGTIKVELKLNGNAFTLVGIDLDQ